MISLEPSEKILHERQRIKEGYLDAQWGYVFKCVDRNCNHWLISPYMKHGEECPECRSAMQFRGEMSGEDFLWEIDKSKTDVERQLNLLKIDNEFNELIASTSMELAMKKAGLMSI